MRYLLIIFLFIQNFFLLADENVDKEIIKIINGMYELESWFDGDNLHKPPKVAGRWSYFDGQVISIIHNRVDNNNYKSVVRWGNGSVKDKTFRYTYIENLNINGTHKSSSFNTDLPFKNMRSFRVILKNKEIKMVSENKNQVWIINEKGMVYNDKEWGENKIFVERKWKRITAYDD